MQQTIIKVGVITSPIKSTADSPLQGNENAPEATVVILPAFTECMKSIKPGDELVLLTWLHLADRNVLSCYPRNNTALPLTGVFSTRSPDRPNPIGLHPVKVIEVIANNTIKVSGLEAVDGTPVIDIKPVISRQPV